MALIRFEELDVFKRAYRVSLDIHRASLEFPQIEQYALADQVRRCSKGICANIAEGFGKSSRSPAELQRFLSMATAPPTRCGCGCVTVWTWAMCPSRNGNYGATNMKKSPRCCRG